MKKMILAFLVLSTSPSVFAQENANSDPCLDALKSEARSGVCQMTNLERGDTGAPTLVLDLELTKVAQKHAEDMAKRGYFSHTSPDGGTMVSRLEDGSIVYRAAGENIARGQRSPGEVMKSWMNSPGHRRNILKSQFHKIGIGVYEKHWVQVFTD